MWILGILATGRSSICIDNSSLKIHRWVEGNLINMGMTMQVLERNQILARKMVFEKLYFN